MSDHAIPPASRELLTLYRHRVVNEFARQIIVENTFYFSDPRAFEDDDDCRIETSLKHHPAAVHSLAKKAIAMRFPNANRRQRRAELARAKDRITPGMIDAVDQRNRDQMLANSGVCCFTRRPDNIRAWIKHSADFSGICLQFTDDGSPPLETCCPVEYRNAAPGLHAAAMLIQKTTAFGEIAAINWFLVKRTSYSWEEEWRAIAPVGKHCFPASTLTGLIFGPRISAADEATVRGWIAASPSTIGLQRALLNAGGSVQVVSE